MRSIRALLLIVFVVMLFAALPPSAGDPVTATGTVVVRTHSDYVAIAVAPKGGGKLERLFVFWPSEPMTAGVKRYERASVEFEPGKLRVVNHDGKKIKTYYVNDMAKPSDAPTGFTAKSYPGKGLSHYIGETASRYAISGSGSRDAGLCYIDLEPCKGELFKID